MLTLLKFQRMVWPKVVITKLYKKPECVITRMYQLNSGVSILIIKVSITLKVLTKVYVEIDISKEISKLYNL